jgi:hypothetical protein
MTERWTRLAAAHAKCSQFFLVLHRALQVPPITVPVVFSLFDTSSRAMRYIVVAASAATALSLAMRLELRSYVHSKASREYSLLVRQFPNANQEEVSQRIVQLLREAPLLLACCCAVDMENGRSAAGNAGATGADTV